MKTKIINAFSTEKLNTRLVKKFIIADVLLILLTFVIMKLEGRF